MRRTRRSSWTHGMATTRDWLVGGRLSAKHGSVRLAVAPPSGWDIPMVWIVVHLA
jgi:hypothetical protein